MLVAERFYNAVLNRRAALLRNSKHRAHRVPDRTRVSDVAELHEPDAIRKIRRHIRCHLERKTRLADAPDAGERYQPVSAHERHELDDVLLASEKASRLSRQIARQGVERPWSRKIQLEAFDMHLEQMLFLRKVAQAMSSEINKIDAVNQRGGRGRYQDLSAVSRRHRPGGAVQCRPKIIIVARFDFAGTDAHADGQSESLLGIHRGIDSGSG